MKETSNKTYPLRRALTGVGIVAFLLFYIFVVIEIGKFVPDKPVLTLIYYGITGVLWGFPLLPLLSWAEGKKVRKK